ncbi:hypothetical protein MHYP_G00148290 [Metynnis hypsauchen]
MRQKMEYWSMRKLTWEGKILIIKAIILPLFLLICGVFPPPRCVLLGADRAIFYFLWGSKWEWLRREVVKRRPENGGKGVPDLYTFLGSIFVATHMKYALTRAEGKTGAMVRFGLGSYLRRLKILKVDLRTPKQEPVCLVRGLGEGESRQVWANAAHPALLNRHRDLAWMAAHEVLPVRAVMHSRGMAKNAICPWPRCGAPETVRHALWECRAAQDLWSITGALWCPSLSAGGAPALRYRLAVNGVGWSRFMTPAVFAELWPTLNSVQDAIWPSRNLLTGKHVEVTMHRKKKLVSDTLHVYATRASRRRAPGPEAR